LRPPSRPPRSPSRVGDILLWEITPCYRGQFAQICRTTVIGDPQPKSEKYAVLHDAMERSLTAGRSGARVTDLTRGRARPSTRHYTELANAATLMHLAAASLGLGPQHVTIHVENPFKRVLVVADLVMVHHVVPVGWPLMEGRPGASTARGRSALRHYGMSKYMSNEGGIELRRELRG
jgi:hypothetical protein